MRFLIGTQAEAAYRGRIDEANGTLALLGPAAEIARPTWLLRHPLRQVIFAVSELGNKGDCDGEVFSFADRDDEIALTPLSRVTSPGGGPTHLEFDVVSETLFSANFGGGRASLFPVTADGRLERPRPGPLHTGSGPHRRQSGPHPHGVTLDPSGHFLLVPDMGADRIFTLRYDAAERALTMHDELAFPPGSGPRLVLFGRDPAIAYLLSELSAELFTLSWDAAAGSLCELGRTALPGTGEGEPSAAALTLSADGNHLYASNRRTAAIEVYAIDPTDGALVHLQSAPSGGARPWAATASPSGKWLLVANQGDNAVCSLRIEQTSGLLSPPVGRLEVPTPTAILF